MVPYRLSFLFSKLPKKVKKLYFPKNLSYWHIVSLFLFFFHIVSLKLILDIQLYLFFTIFDNIYFQSLHTQYYHVYFHMILPHPNIMTYIIFLSSNELLLYNKIKLLVLKQQNLFSHYPAVWAGFNGDVSLFTWFTEVAITGHITTFD